MAARARRSGTIDRLGSRPRRPRMGRIGQRRVRCADPRLDRRCLLPGTFRYGAEPVVGVWMFAVLLPTELVWQTAQLLWAPSGPANP